MQTCARTGTLAGLCLFVLLVFPAGVASADLVPTLNALRAEKDPEKRIALIPDVATHGGDRAAKALARLVRRDPDVRVRVAAARGLGKIEAKGIRAVLVAEILHGGTLQVREAIGRALQRQKLGAGLIWVIESPRTPHVERELALAALAHFRDAETRAFLHGLARDSTCALREVAIRVSAARGDAAGKRLRLFVELLSRGRAPAALLAGLDVVSPFVHPVMRPALLRLARQENEDIAAAAKHALANLVRSEAAKGAAGKAGKAGAKAKKDGRYAKPGSEPPIPGKPGEHPEAPPPERVGRPRLDVVWALDVTGSTVSILNAMKARILARMTALSKSGQSVRIGMVAFRGGHFTRDHRRGITVLPLTFDRTQVETFLAGLRQGGVDDRGSAVPHALHVALDQMSWRTNATREVRLEADGGCRDPDDAKATVSFHFRVDKTRTSFTYTRRTRTVVPPELFELAKLGGTRTPEILP